MIAEAGLYDRAERVARDITDPFNREGALAGIARVMAEAGFYDRAERVARDITESYRGAAQVSPKPTLNGS